MITYQIRKSLTEPQRKKLSEHDDLMAHLLFHRNVTTNAKASDFLYPEYDSTADDFLLLKNIEKVCKRILKAISKNESIVIYADYDADGIPGAVVLYDFFKKIGYENIDVYIPHRNKEGFGLNKKAIETLHEQKTDVILSIDCGISDIEEAAYAKKLGIDLIITDHHEPHDELPDAFSIINPKLDGCEYPEKMLCGCAVIFKVVQALIHFGDFDIVDGWEKWLLDMVGISTISDMVPLTGENRTLALYGLRVLRKSPRRGLLYLLRKTGTHQRSINEQDIGFTISPRINAASRMGEPKSAFDLLSTTDEAQAGALVTYLMKLNDERKGHVAAIVKGVKKYISETFKNDSPIVVVTGNPDWQPSLLGLAANSIASEYTCPVFLWGRGEGKEIKGSCRTIPGVNTFEIMKAIPEGILTQFGGHAEAGGFVTNVQHIDSLQEEFTKVVQNLPTQNSDPMYIDSDLTINDINFKTHSILEKIAPFGMQNPEPLFRLHNHAPTYVKQFGKQNDHIDVGFTDSHGKTIRAIAFFKDAESYTKKPEPGKPGSFIVTIEQSVFRGIKELRMKLIDSV